MSISTFLCKDSLSVIICQMSKFNKFFRPGHNLLLTFNGFTENFKLSHTRSWKHMHHLTYPTPPQSKLKEKHSKANIFFVQIFIHISICGLIYKSKDYIYCMKETKLVCVCVFVTNLGCMDFYGEENLYYIYTMRSVRNLLHLSTNIIVIIIVLCVNNSWVIIWD